MTARLRSRLVSAVKPPDQQAADEQDNQPEPKDDDAWNGKGADAVGVCKVGRNIDRDEQRSEKHDERGEQDQGLPLLGSALNGDDGVFARDHGGGLGRRADGGDFDAARPSGALGLLRGGGIELDLDGTAGIGIESGDAVAHGKPGKHCRVF